MLLFMLLTKERETQHHFQLPPSTQTKEDNRISPKEQNRNIIFIVRFENWIFPSRHHIAFMLRASVKILVNDIMVNDLSHFMVMSFEIEFKKRSGRVFKSHRYRFFFLSSI